MKNYIKPSIELTKFDVEDIITVSGDPVVQAPAVTTELSAEAMDLYNAANFTETATNFVEFQW